MDASILQLNAWTDLAVDRCEGLESSERPCQKHSLGKGPDERRSFMTVNWNSILRESMGDILVRERRVEESPLHMPSKVDPVPGQCVGTILLQCTAWYDSLIPSLDRASVSILKFSCCTNRSERDPGVWVS